MANVTNLEIGVERALKAYLKERRVDDAAIEKRVKAKLSQAVAIVRDKLAEQGNDPNPGEAFAQLKAWAATNV